MVTGFTGQTGWEATHALQPLSDIRQEVTQRHLQVDVGTLLHGMQADAAQRVSVHVEVKGWNRAAEYDGVLGPG